MTRFESECVSLYTTVGVYTMLVSPLDGATIIEHSTARGKELAKVCARHPTAKKVVTAITTGNDITALIAGDLALAGALLANHPSTQAAFFGGVRNTFARIFRREQTPAPIAPTQPQSAAPVGFDPQEPPELRSYDAKLPVFRASPQHAAVMTETTYDGFNSTDDAARLAATVGLATG